MQEILIDTNLLVLLIVGLTKRPLIGRHKRTRNFEEADFDLLTRVLARYGRIVVTPHILAETSNLLSQIGEPNQADLRKGLMQLLPLQREEYQPSADIAKHRDFLRLGLTDCAILELVNNIPLITVDLDLYLAASKINHAVVNFNHLRQERLLKP